VIGLTVAQFYTKCAVINGYCAVVKSHVVQLKVLTFVSAEA